MMETHFSILNLCPENRVHIRLCGSFLVKFALPLRHTTLFRSGAGYAGGIMSAAVDGLRVARAIISRYSPAEG